MIIGKMTKICHDMPTELAIATMIPADVVCQQQEWGRDRMLKARNHAHHVGNGGGKSCASHSDIGQVSTAKSSVYFK